MERLDWRAVCLRALDRMRSRSWCYNVEIEETPTGGYTIGYSRWRLQFQPTEGFSWTTREVWGFSSPEEAILALFDDVPDPPSCEPSS